ncbi:MAG TPA: D-alanine--D-alanine ligase family protein [Bryobacteraceae bacterium]|jgi:D-alanine-D-alanine ligase|nr:D-alanine--D-alanine ligase family protein [Bryobacteraceae bacterium]
MPHQNVAVVFGGRSVEHEVSIISASQVMDALEVAGYKVLPVYIAKDGAWYAGRPLRELSTFRDPTLRLEGHSGVYRVALSPDRTARLLVLHPYAKRGFFKRDPELWADVFFPCLHGSFGEDGTLQGVFEMADVPYVGCGVLAASLGMDKIQSKSVCRSAGIRVLDCVWASRGQWQRDPLEFLKRVEASFPYPVIVKPCSLGSSIGVKRCLDSAGLRDAVDTALVLDERVLIEPALTNFREVNCSVIGPPYEASTCEMPHYKGELLSFESKYSSGGKSGKLAGRKMSAVGTKSGLSGAGMASLNRTIPAPISEAQTAEAKRLAVAAFEAIGGEGIARIDFLLDDRDGRLYFNEINTMPGSLAYYLWEASGVGFDQLVSRLVEGALRRSEARHSTQFAMDVNLLHPARR